MSFSSLTRGNGVGGQECGLIKLGKVQDFYIWEGKI